MNTKIHAISIFTLFFYSGLALADPIGFARFYKLPTDPKHPDMVLIRPAACELTEGNNQVKCTPVCRESGYSLGQFRGRIEAMKRDAKHAAIAKLIGIPLGIAAGYGSVYGIARGMEDDMPLLPTLFLGTIPGAPLGALAGWGAGSIVNDQLGLNEPLSNSAIQTLTDPTYRTTPSYINESLNEACAGIADVDANSGWAGATNLAMPDRQPLESSYSQSFPAVSKEVKAGDFRDE